VWRKKRKKREKREIREKRVNKENKKVNGVEKFILDFKFDLKYLYIGLYNIICIVII
jgi:hypothetical protein